MSICVLRSHRLTIRLRPRSAGSTSPAWPLWSSERDRGRPTTGRSPPAATGTGAVAEFQREALSYLGRAKQNWNLAYGFPLGTITVGLHTGVAATEWHLHAWDLTSTDPEPHSPKDSAALFRAAGAAVAEAEGGVRDHLTALLVPIAARRSPGNRCSSAQTATATTRQSTDLAFRIERTFSDR